ncbi:oxidoreductase [Novosphingobium sp. PS1R-30]|uniref:Oxidoreductase n=1 Tax=Novosphingobium anseongense TaxID=3133436 RepID=A0ABU8RRK9_9SPHN|nr:MAG: SDR family NAD(P)-dependent oxidoreductase [Novosphingobium sp.]
MSGFTAADVPDQTGRTIIVTGANTGLGYEAARVLAAKGARVLLACRDQAKAEAAMAQIRAEAPAADLAFLPLDQADLASVRRAADLAAQEPRIDVLLNNAGVMFPPLTRTKDGFELQFGVNHLGTFALTGLLLPKLAETPGARIVVTASLAHNRGKLQWDDLGAEKGYNRTARYSDSKLANMLHFAELDRRLRAAGSPVIAVGCHPGVAATELMRHAGPFQVFTPLFGLFLNTAEQGAWPALEAATAPGVQGGEYYGPQGLGEMRGRSGLARRTAAAKDPELARRLWDVSVAMTGIDPGLAPA